MAYQAETYRRFCVQDTLLAADATRTLLAGAVGTTIVVTRVKVTGLTAAAQAFYVGNAGGTIRILSVGVSLAVNSECRTDLRVGIALGAGEDLVIKPAAAGPSVHCVVEGFIKGFVSP